MKVIKGTQNVEKLLKPLKSKEQSLVLEVVKPLQDFNDVQKDVVTQSY